MDHASFVQAYRSGKMQVAVPTGAAVLAMSLAATPARLRAAYRLWCWIAVGCLCGAVAVGILIHWGGAVAMVLLALGIHAANRRSACQHFVEACIENEGYWQAALNSKWIFAVQTESDRRLFETMPEFRGWSIV